MVADIDAISLEFMIFLLIFDQTVWKQIISKIHRRFVMLFCISFDPFVNDTFCKM